MTSTIVLEAETYSALQTELQHLRQQVAQQTHPLQALHDRLPGCTYELHRDARGRLDWQHVSAGSQELFGLEPDEMHRFPDLIAAPDRNTWEQAIALSSRASAAAEFSWQGAIQRPDGRRRNVRFIARRDRLADDGVRWSGIALPACDFDDFADTPEFFATLIDRLPVAVIVKAAADLRFCAVNSAGADLLGFEPEELLGKTDFDLYPIEQAIAFQSADVQVLQGRSTLDIPEEPVRVGDCTRLMRTRKFAIWDGDRPTHLVVVCEDITDRKRAERHLAEQERTLRAIVENAPIWIWTTDLSGHMTFINQTFCNNVGITPDTVYQVGHYKEAFGEDAVRNCIESDRISFAQDEPCFADEIFPFVDGELHQLETIKVRLKDERGNVIGLVGLAVDATERKQAAERLKQLNQRYEQLAQNFPGMLYRFRMSAPDDRGIFEYASPGARQLFELPPEALEADAGCVWSLVHPEDMPGLAASVAEAFATRSNWQDEFRVQLPSGQTRWIEGTASLNTCDDRGLLFEGMKLDITERKHAELALAQQRSLFDSLIATAPIGIAMFDRQLRYLHVNERVAELSGRSVADHIGRPLSEMMPQLAPFLCKQFQQILDTGTPILDREFSGRTPQQPDVLRDWLLCAFPIYSQVNGDSIGDNAHDREIVAFGCTLVEITERKQAEARVRQSEQELAQLVDATPLAVIHFSPSLDILSWNPGAERIFGYSRAEAIGRSANDLIVSGSVFEEVDLVRRALVDRKHDNYSLNPNLTKDGRTIICEWYNTPIVNDSGQVTGIVSQAIDITERYRAEAQLQTLTRNLQDAQRIAHIGNWEIDLASGNTTWSEEIFRIVGRDPHAGQPSRAEMFDRFHPDDRPRIEAAVQHCIDTGQPYDLDARIVRTDGSLRYVREKCEPQYDRSGQLVSVFGIAMDITDRKTAELTLRRSEERFRTLVEATSQIVWMTDKKGCFTREQTDWSAFTGQDFETQRNWGWINAIHPDDRNAVSRRWSQSLQTQSFYRAEYRLRRADGEYRDTIARGVPILDDDGQVREWIGVNTDITEKKAAERALQASEAELRQQAQDLQAALNELQQTQNQLVQSEKMSALGQLVAGVAHEINNPVNFIYGNLTHADEYASDLLSVIEAYQEHYPQPVAPVQELMEDVDLEFLIDDLPKLLASMRVGAQRIRDIVRSLRNFSRLDESAFKTVDLHEGIDSTLTILHNRLKAKSDSPGIELVKEYGQLPPVECYAGQINQVFMNVLSNAIDALEERDRQRKPSELHEAPSRITISTRTSDRDTACITITDNGVGMPPDVRQHIFDPFFTTKPIGKGTGLGMSISYQIVTENHGGNLACRSEPGVGTTFEIEIPLHR